MHHPSDLVRAAMCREAGAARSSAVQRLGNTGRSRAYHGPVGRAPMAVLAELLHSSLSPLWSTPSLLHCSHYNAAALPTHARRP